MTKSHKLGFEVGHVYLEAEVHPNCQQEFSKRYLAATRSFICTGAPEAYLDQPNKWGAELRIYFNAEPDIVKRLEQRGYKVERTSAYRGTYAYRINNNNLWWELVENGGFRLGEN